MCNSPPGDDAVRKADRGEAGPSAQLPRMRWPMSDSSELVAYETLDEGRIARIWLNRPEAHNAQSRGLLVELDAAFLRAEADDTVRVVILAARGRNFSAGHALGSELALAERAPGPGQHPTFRINGATRGPVAEKPY